MWIRLKLFNLVAPSRKINKLNWGKEKHLICETTWRLVVDNAHLAYNLDLHQLRSSKSWKEWHVPESLQFQQHSWLPWQMTSPPLRYCLSLRSVLSVMLPSRNICHPFATFANLGLPQYLIALHNTPPSCLKQSKVSKGVSCLSEIFIIPSISSLQTVQRLTAWFTVMSAI